MTSDQFSEDVDAEAETIAVPVRIGRYQIEQPIGSGGFGTVYLAFDTELQRQVALKVPHRLLMKGRNGAKEYLAEARLVANLDHPNIVPVYDVGSTDEHECYVVSKYIAGEDLGKLIRKQRLSVMATTQLVATIADALHHAHKRGIVHRDVKPSNILIETDGKPYLADFGLALPERSLGTGPRYAGTPAYMSPEQARGEGHRVDGRSDIFSLGAVLYELLTGKRAFRGDTKLDLFESVANFEPKPVRQYDECIPKELERICQKMLAKRASERYSTAHDLAEDLRGFIASVDDLTEAASFSSARRVDETTDHRTHDSAARATTHESERAVIEAAAESHGFSVVPKGLRSFDAHDADFFLELLPGPRGRDGLPENLRFWKDRIEEVDADNSFSVGLIYGPSGCGKSSFVKAGLIPRLSKKIVPLFVESSADFTEKRLLQAIHKNWPEVEPQLGLADALAMIRRGEVLPPGQKILIVLDQFEQWLHAHRGEGTHELFKALRQCDGERVQAILLVRSDFWMAVMWFLNDLEVELVQGRNFAAIDMFPPRHAEKVLIAFGRAFGVLPENDKLSSEQMAFIRQSIEGLTQDGKVMSVRLSVYAEMMKNKRWTPASLKQIGGTEGVGVSFLEDCFGSQANPRVRMHESAARSVLRSLLPDSETSINVRLEPYEQLFRASGYNDRRQFDDLLRVLDSEMRMISPTDPLGMTQDRKDDSKEEGPIDPTQRYYRLSHDYLVNALRNWLSRKQRESRKGRAELLLAERAQFWNAKKENRYLPSILEHARIRLLTSKSSWTAAQREMMRTATRTHGLWLAVAFGLLSTLAFGAFGIRNVIRSERYRITQERLQSQYDAEASRLVDALLNADTTRVADIADDLRSYKVWGDSRLQKAFDSANDGSREKLHSAMVLASDSPQCRDYLVQQLPLVNADQLMPVCNAIRQSDPSLPNSFVEIASDPSNSTRSRILAACAVAQMDDKHAIWQDANVCSFVAESLTRLYPSELAPLRVALLPVADALIPRLQEIFLDRNTDQQQRLFATESLVQYRQQKPDELFAMMLDCDEMQFPLAFRALAAHQKRVIELANGILETVVTDSATEPEKDLVAEHKANATVALYLLEQYGQVWPQLDATGDPRVAHLLIHYFANRGCNPKPLLERLDQETSPEIKYSLLLALGEFSHSTFQRDSLTNLIEKGTEVFQTSSSADLRAASMWLLNSLGQDENIAKAVKADVASQRNQLDQWLETTADLRREASDFAAGKPLREADMRRRRLEAIQSGPMLSIPGLQLTTFSSADEFEYRDPQAASSLAVRNGPIGDVLFVDGASTLKIKNNPIRSLANGLSYGCWLRTDDNKQYGAILSCMNPAENLQGFDIWIEGGMVCAHFKKAWVDSEHPQNSLIKVIASKTISDNVWHHVMVCYDGGFSASGVQIFIDGRIVPLVIKANSLREHIDVSGDLVVGGRPAGYEVRCAIGKVRLIEKCLSSEETEAIYFSDVQSLAGLSESELSVEQKNILKNALEVHDIERSEADQKWEQQELARIAELARADANWRYTSQGHWMIRIQADRFRMGSPLSEQDRNVGEEPHTRIIQRDYELSAYEVTAGQWRAFREEVPCAEHLKAKYADIDKLAPELPIVKITWFEAAQYCNWLSAKEGIPPSQWCYVPDDERGYDTGMQVKPMFWKLSGYRLPTESEWEYACRAGSASSRFYGTSERLLGKYAQYQVNSPDHPAPVAKLKPNAWGFFDMIGNASEWCFDLHADFPYGASEAVDEPLAPAVSNDRRVLRGAGFYDRARYVRSAHRYSFDPSLELEVTGLRIARTIAVPNTK